jgi:invasion protein IalB
VKIAQLAAAAAALLLVSSSAYGQTTITTVARHQAWDVFTTGAGTAKQCWAGSLPTAATIDPPDRIRDQAVFMVLVIQGGHQQPSIDVGYPLGADVTVTIDGGQPFTMIVYPEANDAEKAWLRTDAEDDLLVAAMRRGQQMVVRARSARGASTTDTFSLLGISAALDRAAQECR